MIGAVAVWSIWGGDMFPKEPDPTGGISNRQGPAERTTNGADLMIDPEKWTDNDMRRWLTSVCGVVDKSPNGTVV